MRRGEYGTRARRRAPIALALTLATAMALLVGAFASVTQASAEVTTESLCSAPSSPDVMSCFGLRRTDISTSQSNARALRLAPDGYGPSDLQSAYALTDASASLGSGSTVAIVDAYDDPSAEDDMAAYRDQYGLPPCTSASGCFSQVDQNGGQDLPPYDKGWSEEESLDLDMVSAICPLCHILFVEADDDTLDNLAAAESYAGSAGVDAISNSWGATDNPAFASYDSFFDIPGTAVTVSTGDADYGTEFPAASQFVTSVGGTSLTQDDTTARGWSESVWRTDSTEGTGSGCSRWEARPDWQTGPPFPTVSCANRVVADVSADADPATGVAVYRTHNGSGGWNVYGGTSASSPMIAAIYGLTRAGQEANYPASIAYARPFALNDVTAGKNGSCAGTFLCTAMVGYDGPTGLGTPNGIAAFGSETIPSAVSLSSAPAIPFAGSTATITARVTSPGGGATPTGSVQFFDAGTPIGTDDLDGTGRASVTTGALTIGDHVITADYSGDTNYDPSSADPFHLGVTKAPTIPPNNAPKPPTPSESGTGGGSGTSVGIPAQKCKKHKHHKCKKHKKHH